MTRLDPSFLTMDHTNMDLITTTTPFIDSVNISHMYSLPDDTINTTLFSDAGNTTHSFSDFVITATEKPGDILFDNMTNISDENLTLSNVTRKTWMGNVVAEWLFNILVRCQNEKRLPPDLLESNTTSMQNIPALLGYCRLSYQDRINLKTATNIWIYCSPIVIVVGTIGNILSFRVMLRRRLRQTTTALYLIVLSVADTCVLYSGLLRQWIRALQGTDVRNFSDFSCKFHIFIVYLFLQFQAWILVAITIERLVAVTLPHRSRKIFTRRSAVLILLVVFTLLACVNSHYFWTHKLMAIPSKHGLKYFCMNSQDKKYAKFLLHIWPWLDFALVSLVPFIIMFMSNSIIAFTLLHHRYVRIGTLNNTNTHNRTSGMTATLLILSFAFFLTTAPLAVYIIMSEDLKSQATLVGDGHGQLKIVWACINILAYTNNAMNFFLYCISGPTFRKEFWAIFNIRKETRVLPTETVETCDAANTGTSSNFHRITSVPRGALNAIAPEIAMRRQSYIFCQNLGAAKHDIIREETSNDSNPFVGIACDEHTAEIWTVEPPTVMSIRRKTSQAASITQQEIEIPDTSTNELFMLSASPSPLKPRDPIVKCDPPSGTQCSPVHSRTAITILTDKESF